MPIYAIPSIPLRHTFVSILGEEEEDAILTDAGRNEAAYASRMKNGGWLQFDMPFSIPLLNTVSGTEKAWS
jgi:hypothetical protein